jgi:hypothetical protein
LISQVSIVAHKIRGLTYSETVIASRAPLHRRRAAGIDDLWRRISPRETGPEPLASRRGHEKSRTASEASAPLRVVHRGEDKA